VVGSADASAVDAAGKRKRQDSRVGWDETDIKKQLSINKRRKFEGDCHLCSAFPGLEARGRAV
jgi:hypothetical protein